MTIGPDHWLEGVTRVPLPGHGRLFPRRFLVLHFTEGWTDAPAVMRERNVSAHFVVKRDGKIQQCVACDQIAYHAGQSKWHDPKTGILYNGLNNHAIGIEIENAGTLPATVYPSTMGPLAGKPIPKLKAHHKHETAVRAWEMFPEVQVKAVEELSKALVDRYNLDDVVGHDDIAPDRKVDPGPALDVTRIRRFCGFTAPLARL